MRTFEGDRLRRSPSCVILGYRGRAYPKSPQMKICDRTRRPALGRAVPAAGHGVADAARVTRRMTPAQCRARTLAWLLGLARALAPEEDDSSYRTPPGSGGWLAVTLSTL